MHLSRARAHTESVITLTHTHTHTLGTVRGTFALATLAPAKSQRRRAISLLQPPELPATARFCKIKAVHNKSATINCSLRLLCAAGSSRGRWEMGACVRLPGSFLPKTNSSPLPDAAAPRNCIFCLAPFHADSRKKRRVRTHTQKSAGRFLAKRTQTKKLMLFVLVGQEKSTWKNYFSGQNCSFTSSRSQK